jgi:Aminotransferase class I and II
VDRTAIAPIVLYIDLISIDFITFISTTGTTQIHRELEKLVARFIGKEDAVVFNMGYGTNSSSIPCFAGKGTLVVSVLYSTYTCCNHI